MNKITISFEGIKNAPWLEETEPFIQAVLKKLEKRNWDLSILYCNNTIIRTLNKEYRNRDEPTDALSFVMGETQGYRFIPGDIVVSLEMIEENARYFGVSPGEELRRLLIHGILHLAGMEHASNDYGEPMLILQEKLLEEIQALSFECLSTRRIGEAE